MNNTYKAIKISENVYWVGAVDWGIRDFHGYHTGRGTTYNAFLIMAEKITLIDTVKRPFLDEMISRIASVVEPEKISYFISNHGELDHAGCIPWVVDQVKPEKFFTSAMGGKCLENHFHRNFQTVPVKEGETVSLGNMSLSFLATPMLHWPESMFTLLNEEGILFSQDAFGMHLAANALFADELDEHILEYEALKYFANILLPYGPRVAKLMEKTADLIQGINMIAPDHGPIWRRNVGTIVDYYHRWSSQVPTNKALVIYDTMWQSTDMMARAVGEGLANEGTDFRLVPIRATHRSDIVTELFDAGAFLVGSPTLNNMLFPTVADVLCYLKGLKPQNKVAAAFGSYGWSGEAVKQINEQLDEMKVERVGDGVRVKYVPEAEGLESCRALGVAVAKRLKAHLVRE